MLEGPIEGARGWRGIRAFPFFVNSIAMAAGLGTYRPGRELRDEEGDGQEGAKGDAEHHDDNCCARRRAKGKGSWRMVKPATLFNDRDSSDCRLVHLNFITEPDQIWSG